jgi:hypothetical protein
MRSIPPIERLVNTVVTSAAEFDYTLDHLLEIYDVTMTAAALSTTACTFIRPTISAGKRIENTLNITGTRSCQCPSQSVVMPHELVNNAIVLFQN